MNVDANGNPLPINSPLRDHIFVGTTTYKIVVDPTPLPGGGIIVYAALGGKNGGLWRSLDGGNHWTNLSAGVVPQVNGQNAAATDVLLDPASAAPQRATSTSSTPASRASASSSAPTEARASARCLATSAPTT